METGVSGEHGLYVPGHVVVEQEHDRDHVTIQHHKMAVLIAQEFTMIRRLALHHNVQEMETGVHGDLGIHVQ